VTLVREIQEQEAQIRDVLENDESADTEFWESVLKRLQVGLGCWGQD